MKFDAVLFDIDNVLIDTRSSYTDCIIKTVATYLETVLKFKSSREPLLTRKEVELFKSFGGFNDDWDTCYGLLLYFLSLKVKRKHIFELYKAKSLSGLAKRVQSKPLGVSGIERLLDKQPAVSVKRIADIFQRFYLNDFVWNETLMIPASFLKQIKTAGLKTGIITGRNREEADFALRRFQIDRYIDVAITTDDTPKGKRKPDPWGILKAAALLGKRLNYLYVGDLPDDALTAKRAAKKISIKACGFLAVSAMNLEMKKEFKKIKTDYICDNLKELKTVILPTLR